MLYILLNCLRRGGGHKIPIMIDIAQVTCIDTNKKAICFLIKNIIKKNSQICILLLIYVSAYAKFASIPVIKSRIAILKLFQFH